jgi:hypothetical protein
VTTRAKALALAGVVLVVGGWSLGWFYLGVNTARHAHDKDGAVIHTVQGVGLFLVGLILGSAVVAFVLVLWDAAKPDSGAAGEQ